MLSNRIDIYQSGIRSNRLKNNYTDYCPDKVQSKINKTTFSGTIVGTFFTKK